MRRLLAITALTFAALLGAAGPAFAHNTLVGSDPAEGAQLSSGPAEVRLTFDQPVRSGEGYNTITVVGPDGSFWTDGQVRVEGTEVVAPVRPLGPAGEYTIGYRVLSNDGHPVSGKRGFTLTEAGTGTPAPPPDADRAEPDSGGGMPIWPWIAGAVVLVALGLVLALRLGRSGE
ncbi:MULTISPECIES: copper resistance CopC family protein [Saccharopolyspora]|uniref:Copper resistance protein CopC n=1 Tax=Saccharopolyspora gregorii TaxID=33914 RepID=A0ABP6RZT0_9PSEU|nr:MULTISPECIES: copper resistance CopC family protein [Saccharopolyspora]MCA1186659.1 copper resistance protein CopC [Saccharopolyspora sp. 6T]MCA1191777.1 copper resistance protein CopC [Saccharopolyspora sp. 6V]MCA1227326.1 copper resistance protein CopC [Saccharopolyspora sp. 6M]MCA1281164.1 copper resistance protein CopC [Saccharopolyspora sp. 7B]